jgi:hypothetical protein
MTRSSRAAVAVPVRATRRNTTCDRKAGAGSVIPCHRRNGVKRGGAGHANWGRPGDELYDYDYEVIDCTEPSPEEALVNAAGLEWSEVDELSEEDRRNMGEVEAAMREDWLSRQATESQQIQDEGEDFFNSLDPTSWVE